MPDYFTRAEAESLLPRITPVLREIQRLRRDQTTHNEAVAADRAKILGNGHLPPDKLLEHQAASAAAERQIARLARAVSELGILIKDFDTGLVDFPAMRAGRVVYLCWQLGEPHITWWHETSTGFAGRMPLEDDD
ncbi:MAG TPA: DUF2203 domain-containing protein [Ktedonobacterales bacterium]